MHIDKNFGLLSDLISTEPLDGVVMIHAEGFAPPLDPPADPPVPADALNCATIGERDWALSAIEDLCVEESPGIVIVDGRVGPILVRPGDLPSRHRPVWPQLRKILRDQGASLPRVDWREQREWYERWRREEWERGRR
jgi:hypothetical protein